MKVIYITTQNNDGWGRASIIEHALGILEQYDAMTVRQLHYQLVAVGMPNDTQHYKRVVAAMTEARWSGAADMEAFIDRERSMFGETDIEDKDLDDMVDKGKAQVQAWMNNYDLGFWVNQPKYVEVWIEKKALQGVFEDTCNDHSVGLAACKGYPSLTFLNEAVARFPDDKEIILLYFGDYDPSGEDIPRSIQVNLSRMGVEVQVQRIALSPEQISEYHLPGKPAKLTDTRTRNWSGDEVVELDALRQNVLRTMCDRAISTMKDEDATDEYFNRVKREQPLYRKRLRDFINELAG